MVESPDLGEVGAPNPWSRPLEVSVVATALAEVLESRAFAGANRSRDFLLYTVTETLAGRGDRLSEHSVARHALGRDSFDGRLDSSVRVQATRVRTALERYYVEEGMQSSVRISLPVGSYAPVIAMVEPGGPLVVTVLPFEVVGEPVASLIGATLTAAMVHRLRGFSGVRAVGPFPESPVAIEPPARSERASVVLLGKVSVCEQVALVEAQVVDAEAGEVLWSTSEIRPAREIVDCGIEDRWTREIEGQLAALRGIVLQRGPHARPLADARAHAARVAFAAAMVEGEPETVVEAVAAVELALLSERTAELLAMRGALHNAAVVHGASADTALDLRRAELLAREALDLQSTDVLAYLVLGTTLTLRGQAARQ